MEIDNFSPSTSSSTDLLFLFLVLGKTAWRTKDIRNMGKILSVTQHQGLEQRFEAEVSDYLNAIMATNNKPPKKQFDHSMDNRVSHSV